MDHQLLSAGMGDTPTESDTHGEVAGPGRTSRGIRAPADLWHLINYTFGLRLTVVLFILGIMVGRDTLLQNEPIRGSVGEAVSFTLFEISVLLLAGAGSAAAIARALAVQPDVVRALVAEDEISDATMLHYKIRERLPWSGSAHINYWFVRVTRWRVFPIAVVGLLFINRLLLPILWYPLDWTYTLVDSFLDWLFDALGVSA